MQSKDLPQTDAIALQDFLVVSKSHNETSPPMPYMGEFSTDVTIKDEEPEAVGRRLYSAIKNLIAPITEEHRKLNHNKNLITRIMTNEFFYYTDQPLPKHIFEKLMEDILDLVKDNENLHLILGSFAVNVAKKYVANIVPFIQCGKSAVIHFISKDYISDMDPIYEGYENLSKEIDLEASFKVHALSLPLTARKIFEFGTTGGLKGLCNIEICVEHKLGIARIHFNQQLNTYIKHLIQSKRLAGFSKLIEIFHVLIANSIDVAPSFVIGLIRHVDPLFTNNREKLYGENDTPDFGVPYFIYKEDYHKHKNMPETKHYLLQIYNDLYESLTKQNEFKTKPIDIIKKYLPETDILFWTVRNGHDEVSHALIKESFKNNSIGINEQTIFDQTSRVMLKLNRIENNIYHNRFNLLGKDKHLRGECENFAKLKIESENFFKSVYILWFKAYAKRCENKERITLRDALIENHPFISSLINKHNLNKLDDLGFAPLHWAVIMQDTNSVKDFIEHKADLRVKSSGNLTPYQLSIKLNQTHLASTIQTYMYLALKNAVIRGHIRKCESLINEEGIDINAGIDECNNTALYYALIKPDTSMIKLLLNLDADPMKQNNEGYSPFKYAELRKLTDIIELFKNHKKIESQLLEHSIFQLGQLMKMPKKVISNLRVFPSFN